MKYEPGYFSAPVRAWPGLCRYEPRLHTMLRVAGQGFAERARRASEAREAMLNSDDADLKWAGRGTIRGLALPQFRDKPPPNTGIRAPRAETYQGKPCLRGHDGLRYRSGYTCVACDKAKSKRRAAKMRREKAGQ
jgi:hypothetical protein